MAAASFMNPIVRLALCAASFSASSGYAIAAAAPHFAGEIDAVSADPGRFKILVENEHVRVIEYQLAPGEKDSPHTHPPKVSYVLSGGKLRIHTLDGQSFDTDESAGAASWDAARGWHYVENIGETPVRVLLVEVKSAKK